MVIISGLLAYILIFYSMHAIFVTLIELLGIVKLVTLPKFSDRSKTDEKITGPNPSSPKPYPDGFDQSENL
jgi:hypothetical protein